MDADATEHDPFGGDGERPQDREEVSIPIEGTSDTSEGVGPPAPEDGEETPAWVYELHIATLRARIEELERELADRRQREQAIVDRYERLLDSRSGDDGDDDAGLVSRLVPGSGE